MAESKSILTETKKVLGIADEYDVYDEDIIMFINSAFANLHQIMKIADKTLIIKDKDNRWSEFTTDPTAISNVKSYVWTYVRVAFDPPSTSFGIDALKTLQKELEWRLSVV